MRKQFNKVKQTSRKVGSASKKCLAHIFLSLKRNKALKKITVLGIVTFLMPLSVQALPPGVILAPNIDSLRQLEEKLKNCTNLACTAFMYSRVAAAYLRNSPVARQATLYTVLVGLSKSGALASLAPITPAFASLGASAFLVCSIVYVAEGFLPGSTTYMRGVADNLCPAAITLLGLSGSLPQDSKLYQTILEKISAAAAAFEGSK